MPSSAQLSSAPDSNADTREGARDRRAAVSGRRDGEEEVPEESEGDPHRADQEILPGGFERAVMPVEVDERRARERRRLDADPEESERLAHGHQRHRREEEEQAGRERRLGRVVEQESLLEVLPAARRLAAERGDAVDRENV